jgi:RNA polymerase II-associated factor 1
LENINDREKQIKAIEDSFRAAKSRPVHQTKRGMEAEWVLPLLPDFDRYDDQFVMVNFDGDPTADSEQYNKLERSERDECESRVSCFFLFGYFFFWCSHNSRFHCNMYLICLS